jgi:hypothetical protein
MSTKSNGVKAQRIIFWALKIPTDMQCKSVTRPMLSYIKEYAFDFLSVGHTLAVD